MQNANLEEKSRKKVRKNVSRFQKLRYNARLFVKKKVLEKAWFKAFILLTLVANSIVIGLEADDKFATPEWRSTPLHADYGFVSVYLVECLLRIYGDPTAFWIGLDNLFDFSILLLSIGIDITEGMLIWRIPDISPTSYTLRWLHATRSIRLLRAIRFIEGLKVLMNSLYQTVKNWIACIIILILAQMYLFFIVANNLFMDGTTEGRAEWGTFNGGLKNIACYITGDSWGDVQSNLQRHGFETSGRLFSFFAFWILNFISTNIIVAVILLNMDQATVKAKEEEKDRSENILRSKKDYMVTRNRRALKEMMENQRKSGVYSNFQEMVLKLEKLLKHDSIEVTSDLCTNLVWLETHILTMDKMDKILDSTRQLQHEMAGILMKVMESKLVKNPGLAKEEESKNFIQSVPSQTVKSSEDPKSA